VKNPSQSQKAKRQRQKPLFLLQGSFINNCKQGGALALRERCDTVTGETCVSASLNINLRDAAVLLFPVCG
jgi:hypothetical protein